MRARSLLLAFFATLTLLASNARAQQAQPAEKSYLQQSVPAPSNAFEMTVATGYAQGFGKLESSVAVPDVAGPGVGIDLGAGYRMLPHWGVSVGGQFQELRAERADATRGLVLTLAAQYHINPNARLDPWLDLGTGYRMLWAVNPGSEPNVLTHGVQLARARLGFDVRISPDVAIAPVIGADATVFVWRDAATTSTIGSPALSTFVFAGLQGRIDVGGTKVGTASVTSATPE